MNGKNMPDSVFYIGIGLAYFVLCCAWWKFL